MFELPYDLIGESHFRVGLHIVSVTDFSGLTMVCWGNWGLDLEWLDPVLLVNSFSRPAYEYDSYIRLSFYIKHCK